MIYAVNVNVEAEAKDFDFGTIYQVALGEKGRGRKLLALTCPENTVVKEGLNEALTIGLTKSGRPRIVNKKDNELYILISTEGGYTRRGNGYIGTLDTQKQNFEVLAVGNGADGDAGRIGYWPVALIKCPTNGIIRYDIAGGQKVDNLLLINNGKVYQCNIETIEDCCDSLGIDLPFDLHVEVRRFCRPSNTEGWEKRDWWYKKTDEIGFSDHEWKNLLI